MLNEGIVPKEISKRLKTLRERTGMSQPQIADKLCVNQSTVSRWERGSAAPTGLYLGMLERLFRRHKV